MRATYYKTSAGQCLREHRLKAGMTQKQVGAFLGLTASGWSRVEKGQTAATVVHLYLFAELVKCSVGEILGEIHTAVPPLREDHNHEAHAAKIISDFERTLLRAFARRGQPMSDRGRQSAYARAGIARQKLLLLIAELFLEKMGPF